MMRVAILGATGYTACELIKLLLRHPDVQITCVTSRQEDRPELSAVHPALRGRLSLSCEPFDPDRVAEVADCVFSALPHAASMESCRAMLDRGCRVIDFSADYRLTDPGVYEQWYGIEHCDPGNLDLAVYGLPELFRDELQDASLVANPGCYPTSAILSLAPLIANDLIERGDIIVDAKSGVSGAGRTPKLATHFPECNESLAAYSVGSHRHTPEIDQVLSRLAGAETEVIFTPHLIPIDRGILSTVYARPKGPSSEADLLESYREYYRDSPFVRVTSEMPSTKDTSHTNYFDVTVRLVRGRILVFGCIDNLVKGASGAAVQNFNLVYSFPETTALM